jgi:hypothetical protein
MMNIEKYNPMFNLSFETIDKKQVEKIIKRLPELRRASLHIGHENSQASFTLQTLQEFSSPLQKMKQCIIQIKNRHDALEESYFNLEEKKLELKKIQFNNDDESKLKMQKFAAGIKSGKVYLESALRELGMFQDMYEEMRIANNLPEDWTEKDFESQELSHMIRSAFRLAIQNLTTHGSLDRPTLDYFEQIGINPLIGEKRARQYHEYTKKQVEDNVNITINDYFKFLDDMAIEFKDTYKLALKRMGLKEIGSSDFMMDGFAT